MVILGNTVSILIPQMMRMAEQVMHGEGIFQQMIPINRNMLFIHGLIHFHTVTVTHNCGTGTGHHGTSWVQSVPLSSKTIFQVWNMRSNDHQWVILQDCGARLFLPVQIKVIMHRIQ